MIDISHLKELFEDDIMIRRYLTIFHSDAPVTLGELKAALHDGAWNTASISAHSLKSQLRYLNENDTAELAMKLEQICEHESDCDSTSLIEMADELESKVNEVIQKIEVYIA